MDDDFTFKAMWKEFPLLIKIYVVGAFVFAGGFAGVLIWAIIKVVNHLT